MTDTTASSTAAATTDKPVDASTMEKNSRPKNSTADAAENEADAPEGEDEADAAEDESNQGQNDEEEEEEEAEEEYESSDEDASGNVGLAYLLEDVSFSVGPSWDPANSKRLTCILLSPLLTPMVDSTTTTNQKTTTFTSPRKRTTTKTMILVRAVSSSTPSAFC